MKKVLRSLPKSYSHKVFAIEEYKDLDCYSIDEMFSTHSDFKMRDFDKYVPKGEVAFKANKKIEDKFVDQNDEFDEVEENFVRILNKGIGKYKGKLPFKCLNYGRIGYFASKCSYKESRDSKKRDKVKKGLYSKECSGSSEDDDNDSNDETLFMTCNSWWHKFLCW